MLLGLSSCQKWLDVKPEDKYIEEDVFKTEQGFANALNGIYLKLGSSDMYGGSLTMKTTDLLAQYYANSGELTVYNYEDEGVKSIVDGIWKGLYGNITNINKFIENIELNSTVLDDQTRDVYKGEAYALRAYLYFDLLRYFAPALTVNPTAEHLPYYHKAGYDISPFYSSTYIFERIVEDLDKATLLLQKDPVIQMQQVDKPMGLIPDSKWKSRNLRMNFYAVKGLQARAWLWSGNKEKALAAAQQVIKEQSKFPWITAAQVTLADAPNRIFSTENLFEFENPKLYDFYNSNFSPAILGPGLLAAGPNHEFLKLIFENWENDLRYSPSWSIEGGKTFPVFIKYKDVVEKKEANFRYKVPGIRLSELYLIASECEPDPNKALGYLNELRLHRNCAALTSVAVLDEQILKEYRKEFYGEGQLWFYYKRKSAPRILSAVGLSETAINLESYTFPVPLSETEQR
ncbi:SusD family protein [Pedobacter nyackensis]|uniref:SusD family protein n=2 Tax=Pedobacter nyackensis TaxID=475255 RepID=A0A1W2BCQ7_9SPHI|nr:SusD family protein [Pedobacter nyackensis]